MEKPEIYRCGSKTVTWYRMIRVLLGILVIVYTWVYPLAWNFRQWSTNSASWLLSVVDSVVSCVRLKFESQNGLVAVYFLIKMAAVCEVDRVAALVCETESDQNMSRSSPAWLVFQLRNRIAWFLGSTLEQSPGLRFLVSWRSRPKTEPQRRGLVSSRIIWNDRQERKFLHEGIRLFRLAGGPFQA